VKKRFMALLLAALLAGGCSGRGDIGKRSIVTVAAVTRREDGGCRLAVEYLTHLGSEEKTYESQSGEGGTFAQAVSRLEAATGKELYLDGCKVLLLEGFRDRDQLWSTLREIDAHGGIRPLTLVAVSPGAAALLEEAEEGESAGEEVFALLTGGELSRVNLGDCLNLLSTPGRGVLLPMVERKEQKAQVSGYLSPGSRGMLQAPAELGSLLPFARPEAGRRQVYTVTGDGYSADWVLEKNRLSIHPSLRDGEPSFVLEAKVEGYLLSGRGQPEGQELARRAQEDICRQLLEEYGYVLEKIARNSGNDIFSLGKHLELKMPEKWQEIGKNWEQKLPEIGLEVQAKVLLRDKKRLPQRG